MTREEKLELKHSIKNEIKNIEKLIHHDKGYPISYVNDIWEKYLDGNDKRNILYEIKDRLKSKWEHLNKIDNKYPFIDEEYQDMDVMELVKMKNLEWYNYYQDRKNTYSPTHLTQLEYEYKNGKYAVWLSHSCNSGKHHCIWDCDDLKEGVLECLNDAAKPGLFDDI